MAIELNQENYKDVTGYDTEYPDAKFKKTLYLGSTTGGRKGDVYVTIEYSEGRLSFTGVIGPKHNGDVWGSCGQILNGFQSKLKTYANGWNAESVAWLRDTWNRWHLNDMRAGTHTQSKILRDNADTLALHKELESFDHYELSRWLLKYNFVLSDNGYDYGNRWLFEPVPADILDKLSRLEDNATNLPHCWR